MSVSDMVLLVVGAPRRRRGGVIELRARLQNALNEDVIRDGASLTVIANGGMITVHGEVRSPDQISRATRVIDGCRGNTRHRQPRPGSGLGRRGSQRRTRRPSKSWCVGCPKRDRDSAVSEPPTPGTPTRSDCDSHCRDCPVWGVVWRRGPLVS